MAPVVIVTRRLVFNAAHRVYNPSYSDEENARVFGKCSNPNWHGHNYTLEVSVEGPIDPETGYVMDLSRLKEVVEEHVVAQADHRNFNVDVPFMQGVIPTTENIVVRIWQVLEPLLAPARLVRLKLIETENNHVEYDGR